MVDSESILQVNEILGRRREYFSRFARPELAAGSKFTDVDYTFAWYLITRLGITSVQADTPEVAAMFAFPSLTVGVAGDGSVPAANPNAESFGPLYLFSPANHMSAAWLESAGSVGSIALCYGLTYAVGGELVETMRILGAAIEQPVFVPLFGTAPGLWRAASMLIGRRSQRAAFIDITEKFIAAFAGDDLDPLRLAEENLNLRVSVQRLSVPGTNEAELHRLRSVVGTLETLVASLRRGALQQEKTIAAMKKTRGGTSPPVGNNGHRFAAEK